MNLHNQSVSFRSLIDLEEYLELLQQISTRFFELTSKIFTGLDEIGNSIQQEHREGNHRILILEHILQHVEHSRYSVNQHIFVLKTLKESGKSIEDIISELSSILGTLTDLIHNLDEIFIKRLIYNPLCDFYYSIENYFWTLNKALETETKKRPGYKELYNFVFDKLKLDKSGNVFNAYKAIGHFRNAIHNNYVHMHEDEPPIQISTWEFLFIKNKHIELKDHNSMFTLLEIFIESLIDISLNADIKNIPNDKIKERFWMSVSNCNS